MQFFFKILEAGGGNRLPHAYNQISTLHNHLFLNQTHQNV